MFACVLLFTVTQQTSADTLYENGNISTTYITIFKDILNNEKSNIDYVFFRSGQYEYTMVTGDLNYDGGTFTSEGKYKKYIVSTSTGNYGNNNYLYGVSSRTDDFSLNTSGYMVYSNLGEYPTLIERGSFYELSIFILAILFALCCLIRPIFKFVLRSSNGRNY